MPGPFFYDLLDDKGAVLEKRCSQDPLVVGPGAPGELARLVASVAPVVPPKVAAQAELDATDIPLIRVLEDIVAVLISKGVVALADLPAAARAKIAARAAARQALAS